MDRSSRSQSTSERELRADLQLMLECLNCQMHDPSTAKQSLLGIASLCGANVRAKDLLREDDGLQFLLKVLLSSEENDVREAAMYTLGCAVENNVYSQKLLTTRPVFSFLRNVLKEPQQKIRLHQTACFLLLSLVTNNSHGQTLARTSDCLRALMNIFKTVLPDHVGDEIEKKHNWPDSEGIKRHSFEVWSAATSALCGCLNNPQNDENQRSCVSIFPQAFNMIQQHSSPRVVRPIMSLIGLATANNYHNQVRVQSSGGVQVLMAAMHRAVNRLEDPDQRQLAVSITSTMDTFIADNPNMSEECGQHGMVILLLQLLRHDTFPTEVLLRFVISLGHLLESQRTHQVQFVNANGVNTLISLLPDCEDQELSKAVKYVLQMCVDVVRQTQSASSQRDSTSNLQQSSLMDMDRQICEKLKNLEKQLSADGLADYRQIPTPPPAPAPKIHSYFTAPLQMPHLGTMSMAPPPYNILQSSTHPFSSATGGFNPQIMVQPSVMGINTVDTSLPFTAQPPDQCRWSSGSVKQAGASPAAQDAAANCEKESKLRLERELEKERSLRRSIEAKAKTMEAEIDSRRREDQAKAVASELLKQGLASQKRKTLGRRTIRKAKPKARLGDSQCVTTESSSNDEMSSNLSDSWPSSEPVRHNQSSARYSNNGCQVRKTPACSRPRKPRNANTQEERSVSHQGRAPNADMVDNELNTCFEDNQSVSVGVQTGEVLQDSPHSINQLSTPESIPEGIVCPRTIGVQTPSHIAGPLHLAVGEKLETPETSKVNVASQYNYETDSEKVAERLQKQSKTIQMSESYLSTDSPDQQNSIRVSHREVERHSATSPCPTGLRKAQSTLTLNLTPRSAQSVQRSSTPRTVLCPPSPCESDFDAQLLKAANNMSTILMSPERRISSPLTSVKRVSRPGTPVNSRLRTSTNATYGRTTRSSSSLSRILAENHRESCQRRRPHCSTAITDVSCDEIKDENESTSSSSNTSFSDTVLREHLGNSKCPACQAPEAVSGPLLNSRTYNIVIETSGMTCRLHRVIREAERDYINRFRPSTAGKCSLHLARLAIETKEKQHGDVYNFSSDETESNQHCYLSPPSADTSVNMLNPEKFHKKPKTRRPRVPYSTDEVNTLLSAVSRQGKAWHSILTQNTFHTSRTAMDLKDKYKQLMRVQKEGEKSAAPLPRQPFSMAEERRLRRGVKLYGHNWKVIFSAYRFAKGRKPGDLRNKWKNMHRRA